jgi:hypothetical protein
MCDIDYEVGMTDPKSRSGEIALLDRRTSHGHANLGKEIDLSRARSWEKLPRALTYTVERYAGKYMRVFGYKTTRSGTKNQGHRLIIDMILVLRYFQIRRQQKRYMAGRSF